MTKNLVFGALMATCGAMLTMPPQVGAQHSSNTDRLWPTMLALTAGGCQNQPIENAIPFKMNGQFGSILIRAHVNEQPATLLVDTGSSRTILSSDFVRHSPLLLDPAPTPLKGSGLVGNAGRFKATMEVGGVSWAKREVLVMSGIQDISNSLNERIDGILGQDILKEFRSVLIDFKHHRLLLFC
jgi:Aspartyl protease